MSKINIETAIQILKEVQFSQDKDTLIDQALQMGIEALENKEFQSTIESTKRAMIGLTFNKSTNDPEYCDRCGCNKFVCNCLTIEKH